MSRKRFIRFRTRRKNKGDFHLELNSLLDVLVILLVFLIKNYTTSEVELMIPKGMQIPLSISQTVVHKGVTVQMSKDREIIISDKLVTKVQKNSWSGKDSIKIKNELMAIKDRIEQLNIESDESAPFSGVINLLMDRSIDYYHIKKIMDVSAEVGFEQFKFIVIES